MRGVARDSVTGGVREQPSFSQTALLWEGSPKPLSLLCGGHPLFLRKEKGGKDSQAYAA